MPSDASVPSDVPGPISVDPDAILRQPFTTVRKGYDPLEVQKYLMAIAGELRVGKDRERDLERRLAEATRRVDELEHLSPQRLTEMLGVETAKVIEAANSASDDIRTKAEGNVARLLRDAQDEVGQLRREAETILERKTAEAEVAAALIKEQADLRLSDAAGEAEAVREAGREEGRALVAEAQEERDRLLRELTRRRKTLLQQIEQLQAGRERLVEAFAVVRRHLDESTRELDVVLPEAKAAADAALQRAIEESGEHPDDEHADGVDEAVKVSANGRREDAGAASEPEPSEPIGEIAVDDLELDEAPDLAAPDLGELREPKAPDPIAGRHSSAVKVIASSSPSMTDADPMASSSTRVADLFARIKREAEGEEAHGEVAARLIPTEGPAGDEEAESDPSALPMDDRGGLLLAELERAVNRHVKRELSDEQNEMLDAIRREGRVPPAATVLPDPEVHVERYASAAYSPLMDTAVAGGQLLPVAARDEGDAPRVGGLAREVAAEMAAELVAPLRDRLESCLVGCADDEDNTTLSDAVASCYREWRAQRVEPLVSHAVVTAFNRGVLAAAAPDQILRWRAISADPCEDCKANASGPGTAHGEAFPSGHELPPAHPGCRCVLVADVG